MPDQNHFIDNDWREFPTVSRDHWLQAIAQGKSSEEISTLRREQIVDFSAINTFEDLPPIASGRSVRHHPTPCILEGRLEKIPSKRELQMLIHSGVSGLWGTGEYIAALISHLSAPDDHLHQLSIELEGPSDNALKPYLDYFRRIAHHHPLQGTIYLPAAAWEYWQQPADRIIIDNIIELLTATADVPAVRIVTIPSDVFHTLGATVIDELAMMLSWFVTYGDLLTDAGFAMELILARTEITLATGSDFFLDLAKFRAIRALIRKVAQAYGLEDKNGQAQPTIRAVSGTINKTLYDPDGNILRNTTEALSAMLGGVDSVSLLPHDFLYPSSGAFGSRVARQAYNILQHEAQIGHVHDPAAGSYFLEDITRQLVEKSWERFLQMEEEGGFLTLLSSGALVAKCQRSAAKQLQRVNTQRNVLVGATRYTNPQETVDFTADVSVRRWAASTVVMPDRDSARWATPRWAASFEKLRHALDKGVAGRHARPKLQLWIQQDPASAALISQRVHYVKDLLTSTGIAYEAFALEKAEDIDLSVPTEAHHLGVVFCGTDSFYSAMVADILKARASSKQCRWIAGGTEEVETWVRQAGANGVLGIGRDVISLIEQTINQWQHET